MPSFPDDSLTKPGTQRYTPEPHAHHDLDTAARVCVYVCVGCAPLHYIWFCVGVCCSSVLLRHIITIYVYAPHQPRLLRAALLSAYLKSQFL